MATWCTAAGTSLLGVLLRSVIAKLVATFRIDLAIQTIVSVYVAVGKPIVVAPQIAAAGISPIVLLANAAIVPVVSIALHDEGTTASITRIVLIVSLKTSGDAERRCAENDGDGPILGRHKMKLLTV